jgi:hypothetical protein
MLKATHRIPCSRISNVFFTICILSFSLEAAVVSFDCLPSDLGRKKANRSAVQQYNNLSPMTSLTSLRASPYASSGGKPDFNCFFQFWNKQTNMMSH